MKGAETFSKPQKQKKAKESGVALKKTAHDAKLKMEAVSSSLQKVIEELDNPELYTHHSESVTELLQKQHQLEKELAMAEEEWLRVEEEMEKVSS